MRNEALEKLPDVRDNLESCVLDILEDEPEGVRTRKLQFRLYDHPACDFEVMPHLYVWMAELKRDGIVVIDRPNKRYLHPEHADKDPEAYRQRIGRPPSGTGSGGES